METERETEQETESERKTLGIIIMIGPAWSVDVGTGGGSPFP